MLEEEEREQWLVTTYHKMLLNYVDILDSEAAPRSDFGTTEGCLAEASLIEFSKLLLGGKDLKTLQFPMLAHLESNLTKGYTKGGSTQRFQCTLGGFAD